MWILSLLHKSFVPFARRKGTRASEATLAGDARPRHQPTIAISSNSPLSPPWERVRVRGTGRTKGCNATVIPAQAGASAGGTTIQREKNHD